MLQSASRELEREVGESWTGGGGAASGAVVGQLGRKEDAMSWYDLQARIFIAFFELGRESGVAAASGAIN